MFLQKMDAMLSSVLKSDRAIAENIQIMRTFIELRELLATHEEVSQKIGNMEKKYDHHFKVVFEAVRALISQPEKKKGKIGFKREWAGG
jgi:hypothetical protein